MDATIVSAMAAVMGSLVGGCATAATAWVSQTALGKRELIGAEISYREALYGDFIRESSKQVIASLERTLDKPETLLPVYELINRIRVSASDAVLAEAEHVLQRIMEQYFEPNLSVEEVRALARSAKGDPLKSFGEACRAELKSMRGAV
jgi:hypothetical protein